MLTVISVFLGFIIKNTQATYVHVSYATTEQSLDFPNREEIIQEQIISIEKEQKPKEELSHRLMGCIEAHPDILAEIKIVFEDWENAAELICRESSFNKTIINKSSGACGLGQALPCSKMGCELEDSMCQLEWIKKYITNRYGSPEGAVNFHNEHNWY